MSSNADTRRHVKHRETARAFITDTDGQVLLMLTHWDPGTGLPPRWLTPGGGIDPGESIAMAALRELREETGLELTPEQLGNQVARLVFEMDWSENRYETGVAHFFQVPVPPDFEVKYAGWTESEWRDIIEVRWWRPEDIVASKERFGPPGLQGLVGAHFKVD